MHEISIMSSVIETCKKEAEKFNSNKVTKISLQVGEKSGAFLDSLRFAFEAISPNTIAEQAILDIEVIPFYGECTMCGLKFHSPEGYLLCQECGGFAKLISGRELNINFIEVEK